MARPFRIGRAAQVRPPVKVAPPRFDFLTFEELSRLIEAMKDDPERLALVLLGAEAGGEHLLRQLLVPVARDRRAQRWPGERSAHG